MRSTAEISYASSQKCQLKLEEGDVQPGADPELTVSRYPVTGLERGEIWIVVTRTSLPAIVKVELSERDTGLSHDALEQIRKGADGIFRGQVG